MTLQEQIEQRENQIAFIEEQMEGITDTELLKTLAAKRDARIKLLEELRGKTDETSDAPVKRAKTRKKVVKKEEVKEEAVEEVKEEAKEEDVVLAE